MPDLSLSNSMEKSGRPNCVRAFRPVIASVPSSDVAWTAMLASVPGETRCVK